MLEGYDKVTLAQLSKSKPDSLGRYKQCLADDSEVGKISAYNFDAIKNDWQRDFLFMGKSADAFLPCENAYYLIEFKTGRIKLAETFRKIYESAMALVENDILSWRDCQEKLIFIVVGSEAKMRQGQIYDVPEAIYLSDTYKNLNGDPRAAIGHVIRDFHIFDVPDFEIFARENFIC